MRIITPEALDQLPPVAAVRELYFAAASEPPLSEPKAIAGLFADLYGAALKSESVFAVTDHEDSRLAAFAYGHPWRWDEQRDSWSNELKECLGHPAQLLEGTYALLLLARDPSARGHGVGKRVLDAWLSCIGDGPVWLQTTDIMSPARHLYEAAGFEPIGHGPDAPNGSPGLVMFRPGNRAAASSASFESS